MLDFPSNPSDGQIYGSYLYSGGVWLQNGALLTPTAQTRNRVCNPAMQISQENGNTGVASTGYPADQFTMSSALPTTTAARQATGSPNGNACMFTAIATAKSSLAAGDYWQFQQFIEGVRIKDFQWGSANAKQVVARFWVLSNITGTFTFYIKNAPTVDRAFCAPFTITTPSVWTLVTIVIPGDTTGTWATDTSRGATIGWGLAAGSTYNTGVAGWQSGSNPVQIAGQTNLAAGVNSFYLCDVGLYLDPQTTGAAPPWQTPDEAQELAACQRYFYMPDQRNITAYFNDWTFRNGVWPHPAIMRVAPTVSGSLTAASSPAIAWQLGGGTQLLAVSAQAVNAAAGCSLNAGAKVSARM